MSSHRTHGKQRTTKYVLELSSELSQMAKVEPFLLKVNKALHLDEVQFNKLFLATSEAVTNSIIHGNRMNPRKKVTVVCVVTPKGVTVHVCDSGRGFDRNRLPNPLAKENLLNESGRGIFLMRTLMDSVEWKNRNGTEVVMKLRTKQPPAR